MRGLWPTCPTGDVPAPSTRAGAATGPSETCCGMSGYRWSFNKASGAPLVGAVNAGPHATIRQGAFPR